MYLISVTHVHCINSTKLESKNQMFKKKFNSAKVGKESRESEKVFFGNDTN